MFVTKTLVVGITIMVAARVMLAQSVDDSRWLDNHIVWSIAHEGCDVFKGDEIRPIGTLRDCYLSVQEHNPAVFNAIRSASLATINSSTERAIIRIPAEYQLVDNFNWVLFHEGQLPHFSSLLRDGRFDEIRSIYKSLQNHNPNARNVLSAIADRDLARLIAQNASQFPQTSATGDRSFWDFWRSRGSPELEEQSIALSIAIQGCNVFDHDNLLSGEALKGCYLSSKEFKENTFNMMAATPPAEITQLTIRAIARIKADYPISEHFNWVLIHEGQFQRFKELLRRGQFLEIRHIYQSLQSHNAAARNLLSALSDSDISALLNQTRLAISIPRNLSQEGLQSISDLLEPEKIKLSSAPTFNALAELVCNRDIGVMCSEVINDALTAQGLTVSNDGTLHGSDSIVIRSVPPAGIPTVVTLASSVPPNLATATLSKNGTKFEEPKGAILIQPERNTSLASETKKQNGHNGLEWYAHSIAADRIKPSDVELQKGTHIGVVDAGVEITNSILRPFFWKLPIGFPRTRWPQNSIGYDYTNHVADPSEEEQESHGTHVTGLVTARQLAVWLPHQIGDLKLETYIDVYSLKVAGQSMYTDFSFPSDALFDGIKNDIHLFNVSLEGPEFGVLRDHIIDESEHALIVVAAGNEGVDMNSHPDSNGTFRDDDHKALKNVIFVGALMDTDQLTPLSNRGNKVVEIAAPGNFISSTIRGGGFGTLTGTSQAAPLVTSTAAILLSEHHDAHPSQIKERILGTCEWDAKLTDVVAEGCELNMAKAIISKTDVIELNSGDWKRGRIKPDQFRLDMSGKPVDPATLIRIHFVRAGDGSISVRFAAKNMSHATTVFVSKTVSIDLDAGETCPAGTGKPCQIDVDQISDVVFRW
jgi:subtilisin family serine protease